MSRNEPSWFGIKLNQKHATQVFILSIAGIFLLSMILVPMISSFMMSLRSAILYGDIQSWIEYSLWYMLPYLGILICFLVITIYSLVKSRKIARSYSEVIEPRNIESRELMYCPNCGNKRTAIEKFCRTCGEQLK